ncbi:MAG TPA: hypothetical protein VFM95_06210 [Microcella sp.]|nr:hypothetical protein [Microcella sp.]
MTASETWGLGADFDTFADKLFEIANKEGVALSIRVRKHPSRRRIVPSKSAKKKRVRRA